MKMAQRKEQKIIQMQKEKEKKKNKCNMCHKCCFLKFDPYI